MRSVIVGPNQQENLFCLIQLIQVSELLGGIVGYKPESNKDLPAETFQASTCMFCYDKTAVVQS